MLYEYIPIHIGLGIASLISFIFLSLSYVLSTAKFQMTFEKLSTYECGFQPFEDSRHLFNISFYLIGILFVIFDLEIVFLFPWCVTIPFLNFFGYKIFILFMLILIMDFSMNYEKELSILPQQLKLYSSSILLLRCFSGNILSSLKLVCDFNLKKSDIIVELNNLSHFWTIFIVLKNSLLFNYIQINDITCVDNLNILSKNDVTKTKNRFSLIYIFSNIKFASQLIVKVTINFNQIVPSLFNLFNCAAWLEREIFDLFVLCLKIIQIYVEF